MTAFSEPAQGGGGSARPGRVVKTSGAATFALVFGVAALISALTVILSWVGLLLGVIVVALWHRHPW